MCDFNQGFKEPEMVKHRAVVILSSRNRLCTVVPLSTTPPDPIENYHHELDIFSLPPSLRKKGVWLKGDHIITVSIERMDRVRNGTDKKGKRLYSSHFVTQEDFRCIKKAVLRGLEFHDLIS